MNTLGLALALSFSTATPNLSTAEFSCPSVSFGFAPTTPLGEVSPVSIATADFNRDGKRDIAVGGVLMPETSNGYGVMVLFGNGDGTFQQKAIYDVLVQASKALSGDFNGDGFLDLIVGYWGPVESFELLGTGDGGFGSPPHSGLQLRGAAATVEDLNRDGKLDLVTCFADQYFGDGTATGGNLGVYLGNGDGTFIGAGKYLTGQDPAAIGAGDFNLDGKMDVVTASRAEDTISVFLGLGDGQFWEASTYDAITRPIAIAVGDLDRDGVLDLVLGSRASKSVSVVLGRDDGSFRVSAASYQVGSPSEMALHDFNRDGRLDLVIAASENLGGNPRAVVLQGNGDGTFQPPIFYVTQTGSGALGIDDFNNDGVPDVAVINNSGSVSVLLNLCVPPPILNVSRGSDTITISWPLSARGFVLESAARLGAAGWQSYDQRPLTNDNSFQITLPLTNLSERYFRLQKP